VCCCPFNDQGSYSSIHGICVECIKGFAKASIGDGSVAEGGVGLRCPVPECKNALLIKDFEFYLDDRTYTALVERLQHEAIVAAAIDDLVTCPGCQIQLCVDRNVNFYDCSCGRRQCRNCPRPYNERHERYTCSELDELDKQNKLEPKLSEVVVRICHRCKLQFVKEDGCNKMKCRCGAQQCYLCRRPVEDYSHFCECGWNGLSGRCPTCFKSCPLWGDPEERDTIRMEEVRARYDLGTNDDRRQPDRFNNNVPHNRTPNVYQYAIPYADNRVINNINRNEVNNNEDEVFERTCIKFKESIGDLEESIFAVYNLLKGGEMNGNLGRNTKTQKLVDCCQKLIEVLSSEHADYSEKKLAVTKFNNCIIFNINPMKDLRNQAPMYMPQGSALLHSFNEHAYRITRCQLRNFCTSFNRLLEQKERRFLSSASGIDVDLYCQLVAHSLEECLTQF